MFVTCSLLDRELGFIFFGFTRMSGESTGCPAKQVFFDDSFVCFIFCSSVHELRNCGQILEFGTRNEGPNIARVTDS